MNTNDSPTTGGVTQRPAPPRCRTARRRARGRRVTRRRECARRADRRRRVRAAPRLTPEQEEGPYYVALEKIRKNITLGRPGVPLRLRITVVDSKTGKPIPNAACDIWHCDATGVYSDESVESTVGQTWLRGVQLTDVHGVAEFETIYPGHYVGRATHIHVKVHVGGAKAGRLLGRPRLPHRAALLRRRGQHRGLRARPVRERHPGAHARPGGRGVHRAGREEVDALPEPARCHRVRRVPRNDHARRQPGFDARCRQPERRWAASGIRLSQAQAATVLVPADCSIR